jgi:hypothetical protein
MARLILHPNNVNMPVQLVYTNYDQDGDYIERWRIDHVNGVFNVDWSNVSVGDTFTLDWSPVFRGRQDAFSVIANNDTAYYPSTNVYTASAFENTTDLYLFEIEGEEGLNQDGGTGTDNEKETGLFDFGRGGIGIFGFRSKNLVPLHWLFASMAAAAGHDYLRNRTNIFK